MKWGIYILGAVTVMLLAGTLPIVGFSDFPTHMFESPLFMVLAILLAVTPAAVIASNRLWRKRFWLWAAHAGLILIVIGAGIRMEKRVESFNFPVYVGIEGAYIASVPVPSKTPESRYDYLPLDFSLSCDSFVVTRYAPDFDLYRRIGETEGKLLGSFTPDAQGLLSLAPFSDSVLRPDVWQEMTQLELGNELWLVQNRKDKDYRALIQIGKKLMPPEGSDSVILAPNHPVDRLGWRFYLMDYGERSGGQVIQLMAVHDPGRLWVLPGLWVLIFSVAALCIQRFNALTRRVQS